MTRPVTVAILGARGYGGGELLRLLTQHPSAAVVSVTSTTQTGEAVADMHPHLRGFYDLRVTAEVDWPRLLAGECPVIFSALPNGASGPAIDGLLGELERGGQAERVRVIDLSGDFRLQDDATHAEHYPETPLLGERRGTFVYGLPELHRDAVCEARRVANPGCLASAAILAAAPLVRRGIVGPLVIDAKTGSSGSGRQLKETTHHPTRHADFRAYKPLAHQHEPEIVAALAKAESPPTERRAEPALRPRAESPAMERRAEPALRPRAESPAMERRAEPALRAAGTMTTECSFVAQSMDAARGIFVTVHGTLGEATEAAALRAHYAEFYAGSPFIRLVDGSPTLQDVVGSNFCDIGVAVRERQVIVMAALDNLVKGMAGTAIQNMNLMCGLPETAGLWAPALRPV